METGNFELHFGPGANRHCREARRERTFDFYTDRLRVVTLGKLADLTRRLNGLGRAPTSAMSRRRSPDLQVEMKPEIPMLVPAGLICPSGAQQQVLGMTARTTF